jgi:hypothetical protein
MAAFMGPPNVYFGLEGILARQVPIPKKSQAELAVVLNYGTENGQKLAVLALEGSFSQFPAAF